MSGPNLIPALDSIDQELNRWLADRDYLNRLRDAVSVRNGTLPATTGLVGLMPAIEVVEASLDVANGNIKLLRRQKKISAELAENSEKLNPTAAAVLEARPMPTAVAPPAAAPTHGKPAKP